jgi:hypothetical protein
MDNATVLSLSFDSEKLNHRAESLQRNGFKVVSVSSPSQARYEIEMGRCGIFITCSMVSDIVSLDLLRLFKNYCPGGITVAVTSSRTYSTIAPHVDIAVPESDDPEGIVGALAARVKRPPNDKTSAA